MGFQSVINHFLLFVCIWWQYLLSSLCWQKTCALALSLRTVERSGTSTTQTQYHEDFMSDKFFLSRFEAKAIFRLDCVRFMRLIWMISLAWIYSNDFFEEVFYKFGFIFTNFYDNSRRNFFSTWNMEMKASRQIYDKIVKLKTKNLSHLRFWKMTFHCMSWTDSSDEYNPKLSVINNKKIVFSIANEVNKM